LSLTRPAPLRLAGGSDEIRPTITALPSRFCLRCKPLDNQIIKKLVHKPRRVLSLKLHGNLADHLGCGLFAAHINQMPDYMSSYFFRRCGDHCTPPQSQTCQSRNPEKLGMNRILLTHLEAAAAICAAL